MIAERSMNEEGAAASDALANQSLQAGNQSAGAMLRAAREKAGLHIGALAVSLKVPVKKLEALESDQIELLPDAVFARALASSICRTLKLDPAPVLYRLPGQVPRPLRLDAKASNASFQTPNMGWRLPLLSRLPRAVVVTASALLVAALALLFLPSMDRLKLKLLQVPAGSASLAPATMPAAPAQTPAAAPAVLAPPKLVADTPISVAQVAGVLAASRVNAAVAPPVAAASVANAGAASPNSASGPQNAADGLVVFKSSGPSWVQVTDASGVVQLRKTLAGGETVGASGVLPLSVTVGRADSTQVLVRGKSFDLAPLVKDNVARFQVK